jgi:hypothetical protein
MKMFITGCVLVCALSPLLAFADIIPSGLPFGGYTVGVIPCTCPPFGTVIQYKPLFLATAIPIVGQLYYKPGTRLYSFFTPFGPVLPGTPGTWNLGAFIPDGGQCMEIDPAAAADADPCDPGIPVPAAGSIRYMGSSLPTLAL